MPARLTLLAHAATPANRAGAFPADEPLDEDALAATAAVAQDFQSFRRVLRGPKHRLIQTAKALRLHAAEIAALDECDYGRWQGQDLGALAKAEPAAMLAWRQEAEAAPHGGESVATLVRRVAAWLDTERDGGAVLALTHGSVLRAAAIAALEAPLSTFWHIDAPPLSRLLLTSNGSRWSLRVGTA